MIGVYNFVIQIVKTHHLLSATYCQLIFSYFKISFFPENEVEILEKHKNINHISNKI